MSGHHYPIEMRVGGDKWDPVYGTGHETHVSRLAALEWLEMAKKVGDGFRLNPNYTWPEA